MGVAAQIRERRKEKGMTQGELAERVSSSRSYICDIECGRYEPSLKMLKRIAAAMDASFFLDSK